MNVMDVILDIENKARGIMAESEEICANQRENCAEELEAFKKEIKRSAEMKIAGLSDEQNKIVDKRLEELGEEYGRKTALLEEKYSANREAWVSDIVSRTLG